MESNLALRLIGAALIILGTVLACNPELVSSKPVPADTFKAIERRVLWGLLLGSGILLQFHHQLFPWQLTVSAVCASLIVGILFARLIGIALDSSVAKQWLNVVLEVAILLPFVWWYFKVRM